jgi:hypothetical protein
MKGFESQSSLPEKVPALPIDAFTKLPQESQKEYATETFERMRALLTASGFSETENVTAMYAQLPKEDMIVRRENPEAIEQLLTDGSYDISFVGDSAYANSVEWKPADGARHIRNAYFEGYGQKNSLVTIVGLRKSEQLNPEKLATSQEEFFGLDRTGVRSVQGTVMPNDVIFITLRLPVTHLDDTYLTEDEIDLKHEYLELKKAGKKPQPVFIHRGYLKENSVQ